MSASNGLASQLLFDGKPFDTQQAHHAGLDGGRLADLVRLGAVRRPFRGVYLDAQVPDTVQTRAASAALLLPEGGVLARRTAAWLCDVDTHAPGERDLPTPLECLVPTGFTPLRRPGLLSYSAPLEASDITEVAGLRVTTSARTAADLARWLPPHMGLAVVDAMLRRGLVDRPSLLRQLERFPGDRWVRRARRAVLLSEPASESYGESWLRLRIVDAGLPRPEAQVVILDADGGFLARVDLADRRRRLVIEYDGQEHHSSDADRTHDARRRASLVHDGWRVLVATRNEVLGRSLALEHALGEAYSLPITLRRRLW